MLALDLLIPCLHQGVFAYNMVHRKVQYMSCYCIATFRNTANTMFARRVVATRCQAKVIRKAIGILETGNVADP